MTSAGAPEAAPTGETAPPHQSTATTVDTSDTVIPVSDHTQLDSLEPFSPTSASHVDSSPLTPADHTANDVLYPNTANAATDTDIDESATEQRQASPSTVDLPDGVTVEDLAITQRRADAAAYVMPVRFKVQIYAEQEHEQQHADDDQPPEPQPSHTYTIEVDKEYQRTSKPYLGGYKHRLTQTVTHHASTQTMRRRPTNVLNKVERQTQTSKYVTKSSQTKREAGTQMQRYDLYMDGNADRIMVPKPVAISGDQLEQQREIDARTIQCFLRSCFAYRTVRALQDARRAEVEKSQREQQELQRKIAADEAKQLHRRMNPRSAADFATLQHELEEWKYSETRRIKEQAVGDPTTGRKPISQSVINEQLEALLFKEIQLLQTIDKLKHQAVQNAQNTKIQNELSMMSSPKQWLLAALGGTNVEVMTPEIEFSKRLVELYYELQQTDLSVEDRLQVLQQVKALVNGHGSIPGVSQMLTLIDRETDLLARQRQETSLVGLRQRITSLYLQFVRNPMLNSEASPYQPLLTTEQMSKTVRMYQREQQKTHGKSHNKQDGDRVLYGRSKETVG